MSGRRKAIHVVVCISAALLLGAITKASSAEMAIMYLLFSLIDITSHNCVKPTEKDNDQRP